MITPAPQADSRPAVMFVDDEAHVLSGLRRMLRHKAQDWTLLFAGSGPEALSLAESVSVDVVVSDMRMPDMDGAALLREIEARHPRTIRFVLSGQSDVEIALRSVGASHQYLSKPCDGRVLQEKIEQALALREQLARPALDQMIARLDLPRKPALYEAITRCLRDAYVVSRELTRIVSDNPLLAKRTVQTANVATGTCHRIGSIDTAIGLIGFETLKALAIEQGTIAQMRDPEAWRGHLNAMEARSIALAEATRRLARHARIDRFLQAECYTAGLLSELGGIVLADNLGRDYAVLRDHPSEPLFRLEDRLLGTNHAAVSAHLLSSWGLPSAVVEAVLHRYAEADTASPPSAVSVLQTASRLLGDFGAAGLDLASIAPLSWLPPLDVLAAIRRDALLAGDNCHA